MENPKTVMRFLIALLIAAFVVSAALSIKMNSYEPLLFFGYGLLSIAIVFSIITIGNVIIYGPLLIILSKLFSKRSKPSS
ncbi:MAG TPA: hypothetical protein VMW95_07285 [Desulfobacterales bacterium]|nr:hypothetical protein [Desulfobacterales bacterium]